MTLIGGQVVTATPAPQGALWFSRTQFRAASAPRMTMPAPVETDTSLAPGAAPWSFSPEVRVVGRPATIPFTWVPWPPTDRVSVSTKLGTFWTLQRLSVGSHRVFRLATTALPPPLSLK